MKAYDYRASSIPACPDRERTEFFKTTKAFRDRGIALRIVNWPECPRSMILTILLYGTANYITAPPKARARMSLNYPAYSNEDIGLFAINCNNRNAHKHEEY